MANIYIVVRCDPDQPQYYAFSTPENAFTFLHESAFGSLETTNGKPIKSWSGEGSVQVLEQYDLARHANDETETITWELVVLKVDAWSGNVTSSR